MGHLSKPKLRNVNIQPTTHQGQPVFVMYDSLQLTDAIIALPQALGPFVLLCNGQHHVDEMKQILVTNYGIDLPNGTIDHLVSQLDEALLLEGGRFEQVKQDAIKQYRAAPYRQSLLAGNSYPSDPKDLRRLLQTYVDELGELPAVPASSRGILSPHIDYQRGGPVYGKVWASAAEAVREAELVIIFATDHNGGLGTLTLTEQNYATPLGHFPTETNIVKQLAEIIGPEQAYQDELHHIGEHSIELVFLWLQFIRQERPCPVVPILCGSFHNYMMGQTDINTNSHFTGMIGLLRETMQQYRTLVVASGDLAHMGPAFDGSPLYQTEYEQLQVDDMELMQTLAQGSASQWLNFMKGQYERNVCGLSPFYFTLDLLNETQGHLISYDRCPADADNTSYVTVCGMVME